MEYRKPMPPTLHPSCRPLCIIHANCQGDPLAGLLAAHPVFGGAFEVRRYTNYEREPIAEEDMGRCRLFIYQHLGEKWDDHASDRLLARVPGEAVRLCIPNMLFKGYWPFWTNRSTMDFGDSFLDHLVDMGLSEAEALHVCLKGDLAAKYDLAALLEASLDVERGKEGNTVVQTVPLVLEHWRTERMFATINHPGCRLLLHVADGVLAALGMTPVPAEVRAAFTMPYDDFELPIHPQVAAFHGLPFGDAGTRYNIYGRPMTYEDYARRYIACRHGGVGNFIGYLQLV
ncbi:MAG TPA: hypothetical protein DEF41_09965 [Desulfovibrio sp.]|nr:hypothetical protein [Desulfovibrio sp.]